MTWIPSRPPRQDGRTFVVTGGNAGLGYFTAEQLARAGAHVVLAGRNPGRVATAVRSIRGVVPGASLDTLHVDLASLDSVRQAGATLAGFDRLDGLVLNAGTTSGSSQRHETEDGFESIMATNFIGHFALAALAWPALTGTPGARVVGLGSIATLLVPLDEDDLLSERTFGFFRAYGLSKHAIQGFILELDRRAKAAGVDVAAVLAHPGYAIDSLSPFRPGITNQTAVWRAASLAVSFGMQGKNRGAATIVRAALDPELSGGEYIGPQHLLRGRPALSRPIETSASPEFGADLWALAEQWTGLTFKI